jgi:hypothetical protein
MKDDGPVLRQASERDAAAEAAQFAEDNVDRHSLVQGINIHKPTP